ncbi:hypothetical protein BRD02_10210 [Halobacteriales archaeon QS_8_69_73]|nr:MAG: hypothetical protein BRD02_10210 [Halobacteriales archaeon QS_8_69_73]
MTSASRDKEREGVKLVHENDGSVTARDLETGIQRGDDTRAEALAQLAEVLRLEDGDGTPIDDPGRFLEEEMAINTDDLEAHDEPPEFLR